MSNSMMAPRHSHAMRSSAIAISALFMLLLCSCTSPIIQRKGTVYTIDEDGRVTISEKGEEPTEETEAEPIPPSPPPASAVQPLLIESAQPPAPEPVVISAAEMENAAKTSALNGTPPYNTSITSVTFTIERLTNTSRYVLALLPSPYVPTADLAALHGWVEADGYCGERLNVFKKEQMKAEKIPKTALYDKIECQFHCTDADDYLVQMFPRNASMMPYKNFTLANKTCASDCLGHQAGWSC